jgi:putative flippase GtrA
VRLLRILPERWQQLVREVMVFGIIGVVNTFVDIAILNILLFIGPLKAKIIATVVATTGSYLMNRYWTYAKRERASMRREYVLFFVLNLIGLAIQLAVLGLAKYGLHYSEDGTLSDRIAFNVANIVGTALAMVFRFWSYRTFVFTAPTPAEAEATPVPAMADAEVAELAAPGQRRPMDEEFRELTAPLEAEFEPAQSPANP